MKMTIYHKVLVLFLLSFTLMIFVSNETNKLTENTIENLLKEKYIEVSDELFTYLSNNNIETLNQRLKELHLIKLENKKHYLDMSQPIFEYQTELSTIKILKHEDNKYLLDLKYLDDEILVIDSTQDQSFKDQTFLNYLMITNILIITILFLIILKMIYPIKHISAIIQKFGNGDYKQRLQINSQDEIGKLSQTFNTMATNIEELITSRQRLLRDMGHELKTPISKSKLAIEMIENSKYKKILEKALIQMDEMTNELLYIEKLNSNQYSLKRKDFDIETLISESLSKLFIDDENLINIQINSHFSINADLDYLTIALKNLIDNALKYSTQKPITIIVEDKNIIIKNKGEKLDKTLQFYCEEFTQGDNSRGQKGYGLGLNLVKRILDKHDFILSYNYENDFNTFSIDFSNKTKI